MKNVLSLLILLILVGCEKSSNQQTPVAQEIPVAGDTSTVELEVKGGALPIPQEIYDFSDLSIALSSLLQDDSVGILEKIRRIEKISFSKDKYRAILLDELIDRSFGNDWGELAIQLVKEGGKDKLAIRLFRVYSSRNPKDAARLLNELTYSNRFKILYDEFASVLSTSSSKDVLSYTNKMKDKRARVLMTSRAFYSALDRDWESASHILKNENVDTRFKVDMYHNLFSKWDTNDIEKVLEHANSIEDEDLRGIAFSAISRKLADTTHESALTLYNSISENYPVLKEQVLGQIIESASFQGAEYTLSLIDSSCNDLSEKGKMVRRMMLQFDPTRDDASLLVGWLNQNEIGSDRDIVIGQLIDKYCQYDFQAAQSMIETQMVGGDKDLAYLVFAENYGEQSPKEAISWISDLSVPENLRNDLYSSVFEEYVKADPFQAAKLSLERGDAALQSLIAEDVVAELAKNDINTAINWIDNSNSTSAVYSALGGLCEELVKKDPYAAYNYSGKFEEYSDVYVKTVWENMASINPDAGINIISRIENPNEKIEIAEVFAENLAFEDLNKLESWIKTIDDDSVSSVAKSNLAFAKLDTDINSSLKVALDISDSSVRLDTLKAVFVNWKIRGHSGIQNTISRLSISEYEKNEIIKSL